MLSDINSHRNDSHKAAENMSDNFREIQQRVSLIASPAAKTFKERECNTNSWDSAKGPSTITIDWVAKERPQKNGLLLPGSNSVLLVN